VRNSTAIDMIIHGIAGADGTATGEIEIMDILATTGMAEITEIILRTKIGGTN